MSDKLIANKKDSGRHYFDRPLCLVLIVFYKAIWGFLETLLGIFIFYSYRLVTNELMEDPQDLLANWIISHFNVTRSTATFGTIVIALGLTKMILAAAIWLRYKFVRELGIVFFSLIAIYGAYHSFVRFSWFTYFALVIDLVALAYFIFELPKHLKKSGIYE
ncbi:MAG: DUF2127 domain-containing protein [Patescibacteria group bacterium]